MPGCCANDYRRFFNRKFAANDLRRYRRRGLTRTEQDLVTMCHDVDGATVLEVGGGIGALQLELLDRGAASATNVELSGGYEEAAAELFAGREVERRVGDFVSDETTPHDVVVMHRVVCCYPDVDALVGKGAANAQRRLLLTYPRERLVIRLGLRAVNAFLALRRCGFRTYVHPFSRIAAAAEAQGLHLDRRVSRALWESASFVRA
jgi:magnesium-protoporphyrin O-methyltransferase